MMMAICCGMGLLADDGSIDTKEGLVAEGGAMGRSLDKF